MALPCAFIATVLTSALLKALGATSSKEKGLMMLGKALGTFTVILGLTFVATKMLLPPISDTEGFAVLDTRPKSLEDELREVEVRDLDEQAGAVCEDLRGARRLSRRGKEKDKDKKQDKARRMLLKTFERKKATLLGGRKDEIVEVEREMVLEQ
ncbi:hypothetical protein EK21DRAFT_90916 [Setomelanomma holmii]|uniref:Amino acid transporter n=1 Tax=Setomelanomma holmii TaxID=210430 RepID=A0A9P4H5L3_9PLEO|nr:hypothetical protein EK21DRAFT_90916 [Setomelanomma holmii]